MNPKPSSLQAILKRRQQEEFVGREEQVALFQENLALPYDNSRRRFIFSVWGQGGVGKTSLLQQFSQIAREKGSLTALTNEDESDMPQVLGRIAEQFKEQKHPLETFSKRYKDYREKKSEIEGDLQAPHGLAGMIGRTLTHTLFFVGDAVPGVRKGLEYLPQEKIAEHVGGYADYLSKKLKNKDEVRLMLNPVEELTPLFLQDLRKVAEAKDLALFFDTFERTSDFVDSWLRAVLEGQHGDMPGNIVLIIAGRNELAKSKWTPFEGLIARLSLEPFTDEEALDYLNRRGITDEQVVETILKLSGQLPLIMATLAVGGASNPEDVGDPSGDAVDRFLKWVEDPKQRQVALDAALLRFLNRDLLAILVGEEEADAYFNWLKKMPFVQERAKGWVYHSVVRQPMLRYKYRETPQGWTETQRLLAEHFEKLLDNLGLDEEAKWRDETWQDYSLNALYHRLCQMPRQHLPVAINDFVEALQVQRDVAIRWAEVMHQAGLDGADADVEAWGERLVEVLKAHKENRYDDAASVFSMLQQYPKLRSKWQPLILGYRGRTYLLMGRYEEALTDFDKVIELDPENAGAYGGRGLTYSLMGRYEEALTDYDKTIELDPENAGAYGGRGETYRLMGRYEEALTDYDKTIELDPENTWVYGSRGEMYRLMERYEEALTDYDKVIELDPENALAYGIRGVTYRLMECYQEALTDFDKTIELDPENTWVYGGRGVTYRLMERYQEALEDFNKAIELNPDSDWIFYQRALLYRILGKEKEASVDITAAIQINQPKYGEAPQDFHNTLRPSIT